MSSDLHALLDLAVSGRGSIIPTPSRPSYPLGTSVSLKAAAAVGGVFLDWLGEWSGRPNPLIITMNRNESVRANFGLKLVLSTNGLGSVSADPEKAIYTVGDRVLLRASPGRFQLFDGWSDGSRENPRLITVSESTFAFTANFISQPNLETLTIGGVTRAAPFGTPAILVNSVFKPSGLVTSIGSANIRIQSTTPRALIFYTVDGADPDLSSILYKIGRAHV